jgi:hypothetical protein
MKQDIDVLDSTRASRRTVVRGAAWTVPVIAVATTAPAFAASPCDAISGVVDWSQVGRLNRVSSTSATYTIPDPDGTGRGEALVLTITNTFLGSNTQLGYETSSDGGDNLKTISGVGGSAATSLTLHQAPKRESDMVNTWTTDSNKSITRFSFSRPVTGLTFTLRDIDSADGDFFDGIALTGATFTSSITNSTYVTGTGATNSPFRAKGPDLSADNNSSRGNVEISMSSVTTFDLHYWNLEDQAGDWAWNNIDQDQKVFLSGFSFSYKPCD